MFGSAPSRGRTRHPWALLLAPLFVVSACDSEGPGGQLCPASICPPGATGGGTNGTGTNGFGTGTTGYTPVDAGSANTAGNTGPSGLPCDVQEIVESRCAACHSDPPVATYMPLLTHAHFHATATTDENRQYWQLASERIHDDAAPMPPVTAPQLSETELATLDAWLNAGAPESTENCGGATGTDGGTDVTPPVDDGRDIDTTGLECYRLLAHDYGNMDAPFPVGRATDAYFNMTFVAPWEGKVYGLVLKPIIDNAQVLHHWLLYKEGAGGIDGNISGSGGWHASGELMHGWAPGGIGLDFREHGDVGIELEDTTYLLEFHYNSGDANAKDASGVEICVQRTPPANIAAMSWLGYDHGIESYTAGALLGTQFSGLCGNPSDHWEGTCNPVSPVLGTREPIHLLYLLPHMHEGGAHMKAVVNRPGGAEHVLHDKPFDFNYQTTYKTDYVLQPGESITTTCDFTKPSCVGQATGSEMCYMFTYAYPKGALTDNGDWGSTAHGENVCLGQ